MLLVGIYFFSKMLKGLLNILTKGRGYTYKKGFFFEKVVLEMWVKTIREW